MRCSGVLYRERVQRGKNDFRVWIFGLWPSKMIFLTGFLNLHLIILISALPPAQNTRALQPFQIYPCVS